jgi:hypothetical protein
LDISKETNYTGVETDFRGCYPEGVADGYGEEYVLDQASVARDDGWVMRFGELKGQVPKGRLYIMKVTTSFWDGTPQQLDEVHVSIIDGKAFGFAACTGPDTTPEVVS